MAKLFCENAQTVIQRSGEIHTMQVPVNLEYWIDNNQAQEHLEVNT